MATQPRPRPGQRIDMPKDPNKGLRPNYDPEMFGRFSERIARYIGSAAFIGWMTAFVVAWVGWNTLAPANLRVDPYPFIFLTLLLSLQASYAAPLILLAQNRQADRDRVQYQEDRSLTERLVADTEYLTREIAAIRIATGDLATRDYLRGEVRDLAEEIAELLAAAANEAPTTTSKPTGTGAGPATPATNP
jgi:uncharacterized membrane protein